MKNISNVFLLGCILCLVACNSNSEMTNNEMKSAPEKSISPGKERSDGWLQLQLSYTQKREQGIDFYAFGNEWSLTIDEDKAIRFVSVARSIDINAPGVEGIQPIDLHAIIYNLSRENGSLSIRLIPDTCINQEGDKMPYNVNVSFKNRVGEISTFNGCGAYLNNPQMNDIWALKSWTRYSDSLRSPNFPGNPLIELNLQSNRLSGNLGCGEITGYIAPKGNKLKIYSLDYLNKSSVCDSEIARELFDYINFKDHYVSLHGLQLQLATASDTLIFQKVD